MPFRLVNAPATFQSMINHIFHDMHDKGIITIMDDIFAHAKTGNEHDKIVLKVLKRLRNNHLCIAPNKCNGLSTKLSSLNTWFQDKDSKWEMKKSKPSKRLSQ